MEEDDSAKHFHAVMAAETNFYPSGPMCWGPLQWMTLHQMVRGFPDNPSPEKQEALKAYIMALVHLLPCSICATHWKDIAPTVKTGSKAEALKWSIDVHNAVNKRTGKPELSYRDALDVIMNHCKNNCLSISTVKGGDVPPKQPASHHSDTKTVTYAVAGVAAFFLVTTAVFLILYIRAKNSTGGGVT
jgi:hypothetical protein